jgi:hypothetical protein
VQIIAYAGAHLACIGLGIASFAGALPVSANASLWLGVGLFAGATAAGSIIGFTAFVLTALTTYGLYSLYQSVTDCFEATPQHSSRFSCTDARVDEEAEANPNLGYKVNNS